MHIGDLSQQSGVPVETIRFYLRDGLLPAATTDTSGYGDEHVRRLRLISALTEVGGVPLAAVRAVLQVIDSGRLDRLSTLGVVHAAVAPQPRADRSGDDWIRTRRWVAQYVGARGWSVPSAAAGLDALADALVALEAVGATEIIDQLDTYADCARRLAAVEVACVLSRPDTDGMLELVVTGSVLGGSLFGALRQLAQVAESAAVVTVD
jgi:DNA-binding transcriptional MerR regulator